MKEKTTYIYAEGGYEYVALHRKVIAYDPRHTDNPIIMDYFNTITKARDNSSVFYKLMEHELVKYQHLETISIPASFAMIYHEINMAWVDIIHQMIFIDNAFDTFYGEYKDVIENIIICDTIDVKESLVYRYFNTGESVFHIAAKTWIFQKFNERENNNYNTKDNIREINKDLRYVLDCYYKLGERTQNDPFCIAYMCDFNNEILINYLQKFIDNFKENNTV